jgi:hypothetical protein
MTDNQELDPALPGNDQQFPESASPVAPKGRAACPGITKFGKPCRATPTRDGHCPNHSPRFTAADRSAWGRRGIQRTLQKRMLAEVAAEAPIFPMRVAAMLVPCHFETARRTLRRYKADFPPPSYSVVNARRVRMVSANDIRTLRRIILGHLLRSIQHGK